METYYYELVDDTPGGEVVADDPAQAMASLLTQWGSNLLVVYKEPEKDNVEIVFENPAYYRGTDCAQEK